MTLRAEILALTGMLSGMARGGDGEKPMEPLRPRGEARVWLARETTLSPFDPLAAALDAIAHAEVHEALPRDELSQFLSAAEATSPTARAANESRIRAA